MRTSALLELDIQVFEPFKSQWSPLSSAVDFIDNISDPASASVMPNPPIYSAFTNFSIYFFFAASVPYLKIVKAQPSACMLTCTRRELDAYAISSVMNIAASHPIILPPYSSGITVPNNPNSAIGFTTSS